MRNVARRARRKARFSLGKEKDWRVQFDSNIGWIVSAE
jgi:hypothetical protein